jgi:hypothetical protein
MFVTLAYSIHLLADADFPASSCELDPQAL